VGAAASGGEAIEQARQLTPDIVLMDINMPDMDGIVATERLSAEVPGASVVMMSVQGEADYLRRSMLAGAREFLVKPFSSDELITTSGIKQILEALRMNHDLVIVDCSSYFNDTTLAILDVADVILTMLTLEITSIKNMRLFLEVADQLGYEQGKVRLVLNRADS